MYHASYVFYMNKNVLYLLMVMFSLGFRVYAQVHRQYEQLHIGTILPGDSVRIFLEYPEYEKLRTQDIRSLKKQGFVPYEEVQFDVNYSVSRGQTIAEVSFLPVVIRNGEWLRIKDYNLKSTLIPVSQSPFLRRSLAQALRNEAASRYAPHSVLSQGRWVKIRVSQEGIFQLSDKQLAKMGFNNPSRVKLYGYGGRLLPEKFSFKGPDALIDDLNEVPLYRRTGSLVFFAEGLNRWIDEYRFQTNTYSKYSYYFLTEGDDPAEWSILPEVSPHLERVHIDKVAAYALVDKDEFVWYEGGRDFYDSRDTQGSLTYEMLLPGNTGEEQLLVYDISAQASMGTTRATITQTLTKGYGADIQFQHKEKVVAKGYRGTFKTRMGEREKFVIKTSNSGRLNYLYTCYTQHLSAAHTAHAFTTNQGEPVELVVADANENTRVWTLGNAEHPVQELSGKLQGAEYRVSCVSGKERFAIVDIARKYPEPEFVGEVLNQDLHADKNIDYIIIVPASGKMTVEAERLAEAHRNRGLKVKVVQANQIYNEFSSGTPDATAYRRYLKMLYDRSENESLSPKYLLLFGDCSYDNRMITSGMKRQNPDDFLLAYERSDQEKIMNNSYSISPMNNYVTDDYFALLDDGEGQNHVQEKIDLGIGRFLCRTQTDAAWLVDNTLSYIRNEQVGVWKNRMWAIGDTGDENLHMQDALEVSRMVAKYANPGFLLRYNFPDIYTMTADTKGATYPEATKNLKRAMKQGALIFNYNGHGSPDRLSHQFLLDKADMKTNVSPTSPIWIFASCDITPYDQDIEDLGRNALYNKEGGAVAVLCSSRAVYANYNRSLNMGFVKYAFSKDQNQQRYTLGDALRLTKLELLSREGNEVGTDQSINKLKYVLLGDPALVLSYPDEGIKIDSLNGVKIDRTQLSHLPIGDVVRFSGFIQKSALEQLTDTTFNGTLTGSIYTPKQKLVCKGYGNSYVDPLQYEDYTQLLFEGSVEVKKGRFVLEFMVPRGISFSTEKALLSLYAVDSETHKEYNGSYENFCFNGSSNKIQTDSVGPSIYMYMNTPDFPNGAVVSPNSVLYVSVSDSSALSMVSGNMGHDMELWLDNDLSTLEVVNDYFSFNYGSYQNGLVEYPLTHLSPGKHFLKFRAWDVFDNSSTARLDFIVDQNGAPQFDVIATTMSSGDNVRFITTFQSPSETSSEVMIEVYSIAGYRIWHSSKVVEAGNNYASFDWKRTDYAGNKLNRGVYLYRSKVNKKETDTKKIVFP